MSKASKRRDTVYKIIQQQIDALLPTDSTFTCATVEALVEIQRKVCSVFYDASRCKEPVKTVAPKFQLGQRVEFDPNRLFFPTSMEQSTIRKIIITASGTVYQVDGIPSRWKESELKVVEEDESEEEEES